LGYAEAQHVGLAGRHATLHLVRREAVAPSVVPEGLLPRLGLGAALGELLLRAEAAIGGAYLQNAVRVPLVTLQLRTLEHHFLVPVQPQPAEPFEDGAGALFRAALAVGVLHAKQELAVVVAGIQPVEERRSRSTHMQVACGGWGEAHARGDGGLV